MMIILQSDDDQSAVSLWSYGDLIIRLCSNNCQMLISLLTYFGGFSYQATSSCGVQEILRQRSSDQSIFVQDIEQT